MLIILGVWVHPKGFFSRERKHTLNIRMNPASLVPSTEWVWISRLGEQRHGQRKMELGFQRLNPSSPSAHEGTSTSFLLSAKVFSVQHCLFDIAWLCSEKGKVNQMNRMTLFCSDICNMHDILNPLTKSNALLTRKHSPAESVWMSFILRNSCPSSLEECDKWAVMIVAINK